MTASNRLVIRDFAQIGELDVRFGDLTVLVGAQGTGKSLALQWLKIAMDGKRVVSALKDSGLDVRKQGPNLLIDVIFGSGMGASWTDETVVQFDQKILHPRTLSRLGGEKENVFYIPAHRSMLISDGWAAKFDKLTTDTPVVARIFSQNLFERFSGVGAGRLFPLDRVLKSEYRELIDAAVFHGGTVGLEQDSMFQKRLKLSHGKVQLPFMAWTAGQREFTPLLLGLYHLLPSTKLRKRPDVDLVVIEEPEMGLHPQAITVFLLLTLELLWRGYRVAISTHSPHVLSAIWMMQILKQYQANWQHVCHAFGVRESAAMQKVAEEALKKDYRVYSFAFEADGKVRSTDISKLDPGSEDERMADWVGLTEFSSRFGDAVRDAVNESVR